MIDRVKETDSEFRREKKVMAKKRIHVTVGDSSRASENMSRSVQKSEERVGTYTVKVPEGRRKGKK